MFLSLFDETRDYAIRIDEFKKRSAKLIEMYGDDGSNHYQTENVITTYLWLRYPEKYCIYQYRVAAAVARELKGEFHFKMGDYTSNVLSHRALYDELSAAMRDDAEMVALLKSHLDGDCYPDGQLRTLTADFGYYIYCKTKEKKTTDVGETKSIDQSPDGFVDGPDCYTEDDFLRDVYMSEDRYRHLVAVLKNKKNVILQGAPGVGKTFAAQRLAWSMMGEKDSDRVEFIQFHQSYSYEDFVMGYKPEGDTFRLKNGVFYRFCQKAADKPDEDFFFIIDEINRGNMSKIFGELLMLIERDYRGYEITPAYGEAPFCVPSNLYIIGMMNTADRSLAMIDYALRRRFSFFNMEPGFDSAGFISYQKSLASDTFDGLVQKIKELNTEISKDRSLGPGFCIGHSYLTGRDACDDEWLREVVDYDILPMLAEYWFDDATNVTRWENILHGVLQQ